MCACKTPCLQNTLLAKLASLAAKHHVNAGKANVLQRLVQLQMQMLACVLACACKTPCCIFFYLGT
jgi:hypothetical protein